MALSADHSQTANRRHVQFGNVAEADFRSERTIREVWHSFLIADAAVPPVKGGIRSNCQLCCAPRTALSTVAIEFEHPLRALVMELDHKKATDVRTL